MTNGWRARLRCSGARARRVTERAVPEFFADGCPKLAAAISYYALFSLFPLAILAVAGFGALVSDERARADVIDAILDQIPLREDRGRAELEDLLGTVTEGASVGGIVGVAGLLLSASAVMGAVRFALNTVWDEEDRRPPLRGKALDVLLVAGAGLAIAASLAGTVAVQVAALLGGLAAFAAGQLAPALLVFAVYAVVLRVVPVRRPAWRDVLPGAAVAAVGYALLKAGFAFYLDNVAEFSAVYASLATIIAFLVFVWVAASLFLLGAEVSAELPAARADVASPEEEDGEPLGRRVLGALRGLVVRPPTRSGEGAPGAGRRARDLP